MQLLLAAYYSLAKAIVLKCNAHWFQLGYDGPKGKSSSSSFQQTTTRGR